jgi:hypothetical protein
MLRFALLMTRDKTLKRWQIHKSDCPDVITLIRRNAFAQILSAESPEALVERELEGAKDGRARSDIEIMPCCKAGNL